MVLVTVGTAFQISLTTLKKQCLQWARISPHVEGDDCYLTRALAIIVFEIKEVISKAMSLGQNGVYTNLPLSRETRQAGQAGGCANFSRRKDTTEATIKSAVAFNCWKTLRLRLHAALCKADLHTHQKSFQTGPCHMTLKPMRVFRTRCHSRFPPAAPTGNQPPVTTQLCLNWLKASLTHTMCPRFLF